MTMRIYLVTEKADPRNMVLVRANSRGQAMRLAAQRYTDCSIASSDEVLQLMKRQVTIIDADTEDLGELGDGPLEPETQPASELFK